MKQLFQTILLISIRLASVQEQRLPGTGPEPGIDEMPRSVDHQPTNKVRMMCLCLFVVFSFTSTQFCMRFIETSKPDESNRTSLLN